MQRLFILLVCTISAYSHAASRSSAPVYDRATYVRALRGEAISKCQNIATCSTEKESSGPKTFFRTETTKFLEELDGKVHLIVHGCAEPLPEGYGEKIANNLGRLPGIIKSGASIKDKLFGVLGRIIKTLHDAKVFDAGEFAIAGAVAKWEPGRATAVNKVVDLTKSGVNQVVLKYADERPLPVGVASRRALRETDPKFLRSCDFEECSGKIETCQLLGPISLDILAGMKKFIENINQYEAKRQLPFFSERDTSRIMLILNTALAHICDANIRHVVKKELADDKELRPCLNLINHLVAIPTIPNDTPANYKKNKAEIKELLSDLPEYQKEQFKSHTKNLKRQSIELAFGHRRMDSGFHLFLAGRSGGGKSTIAKRYPFLLGYSPITSDFTELLNQPKPASVGDLVTQCVLSPIEEQILRPRVDGLQSSSSLHPLVVCDEVPDAFALAAFKKRFDQFEQLHLPVLDITIPGFMNTISTSNNPELIRHDPALIGRLTQIYIPEMTMRGKKVILWKNFEDILQDYPALKTTCGLQYIRDFRDYLTAIKDNPEHFSTMSEADYLNEVDYLNREINNLTQALEQPENFGSLIEEYGLRFLRLRVHEFAEANPTLNLRILNPALGSIINYFQSKKKRITYKQYLQNTLGAIVMPKEPAGQALRDQACAQSQPSQVAQTSAQRQPSRAAQVSAQREASRVTSSSSSKNVLDPNCPEDSSEED